MKKASIKMILIILLICGNFTFTSGKSRIRRQKDFRIPYVTVKFKCRPVRIRYRWNPYAFSYRQSGLVPANLRWNPYAFSYRQSGLVGLQNWKTK